MSDRPCHTPGCEGIGYHPASHPHPLKWCLACLVTRKRERRHAKGAIVERPPFRGFYHEPDFQKVGAEGLSTEQVDSADTGYQPRPADPLTGLKNPSFGL